LDQFFCIILYNDGYLSNSSDYDGGGNYGINSNNKLWIVQNYFATNCSSGEGRDLLKCAQGNMICMDVPNCPAVRPHLSYVVCLAL
jgi:hypothetical protein